MERKIVVTADSTCDLPDDILNKYNITLIPLHIFMGEEEYTDRKDIDMYKIFDYVAKTKVLPRTTATSLGTYTEIFQKFVDEGNSVFHVSLSADLSASHNNACLAAKEVDPEKVFVIDSMNLSTGSGHVVLEIVDRINEGMEIPQILEEVKELIPKVRASFVLETLDYMKKGGRCSSVAALGANILKLKACIEVRDGKMGLAKKYRGQFAEVLKQYTDDRFPNGKEGYVSKRCFVTSTCTEPEIPNMIADYVSEKGYFDEVIITTAGATICSHCGRNTLGVLFIEK